MFTILSGIFLEFTPLFQFLDVKTCGAGIIPYDRMNKKILLGLQRSDRDHFLWSDFGGKVEHGDQSTWNTACRENHEESLNLNSLKAAMLPTVRIYRVIHYIKYRRRQTQYMKLYYLYILDGFVYNNSAVREFEKKRSETKHHFEQEKLTICWINLDSILNFKTIGYRCRDCVHLIMQNLD